MRHLARLLSLAALLAACAALAPAQDTKPQGELVTDRPAPEYFLESWKEFSSKEGRFKVLLPGAPAENVQSFDSPFGKLEMHAFTLQTFAFYGIGYIDFPEKDGIRDVKAFFAGAQAGNLAATKGELLEEKSEYRFASPGRFFKARLPGGFVNRVRLHLIKNRYYIVSVALPEKDASAETLKFYDETAMKFLDSFQPADLEGAVKGGVFGDPINARPLPFSRTGEPEPAARVSGGILNGKARKLPVPEYPARTDARASGGVAVRVVVDESGKVIWALAISGHPSLHEAAEDAAYRAEFEPLTLAGKPVKVKGVLQYNFVAAR